MLEIVQLDAIAAGHHHHRDTDRGRQLHRIDRSLPPDQFVAESQYRQDRQAELFGLGQQAQRSFQTRGVHHHKQGIGTFRTGGVEAGGDYLLVRADGLQRVATGQIFDDEALPHHLDRSHGLADGDTRIVRNLDVEPTQCVEQRGLPGVRVAE